MDTFLSYIKNFAIPILLVGILFACIFLIFKRLQNQWSYKNKKKYRTFIQRFLIEITIEEFHKQKVKQKLQLFRHNIPFSNEWCKELIIDEMIRLKKNLKGDKLIIISILYKSLKLHLYSSKLINDFRPYKKCIGFYHFMMMDYSKGKPLVTPYLRNKNELIRSNANITFVALTNLSEENLTYTPEKISKLNVIKIMDVIYSKKKEYPKSLDFLLSSQNISLIKIGLKIRAFYNHRADINQILQLLYHSSESVQIEVLKTISKLLIVEAEDKLLEIITSRSKKFQINCYRSLANIGTNKTTHYISKALFEMKDSDIQLSAIYCLERLNPTEAEQLTSNNFELQKMLKHVKTVWK
ncbi:MAG: HEAT repeat domain-containing protein [Flavobacterium sp.]|jgi:hypothetical protein|nr:MAG: HEAT repeat domain-containing protein [Flavobacterium sp.]